MGCANSSPLANGADNIMGTAKSAAQDMKHTGEEMLNDVNSSITGTVDYVKDTVVGAVQGMGQELESAIKGGKDEKNEDDLMVEDLTDSKYIPLKEPNGLLEDHLEERKTEMLKRVQSLSDEADKMADELIKETEDVIVDGVEDVTNKVQNGLEGAKEAVENAMNEIEEVTDKTPVHSIDSLKTGTPEPELERILESNEDTKSPSPKPTLMQLEDLEADPPAPSETKIPERSSSSPNMTQDTKQLIGNMMNEKLANSPTKASSHWLAEADGQCNIVPVIDKEPQLTPWERLADAILRKPFPLTHSSKSASIESLTTDTIEI